jgi:hypothetical protein
MAGSAERYQVIRLIASPSLARHDVMDFQEPGSSAPRRPAAMFIARQYFPAHARRDCGRVSSTVIADRGIAAHPLGFRSTQLAFARVGLDGHSASLCIFMDVDLDRRPTGEVPPGALLAL